MTTIAVIAILGACRSQPEGIDTTLEQDAPHNETAGASKQTDAGSQSNIAAADNRLGDAEMNALANLAVPAQAQDLRSSTWSHNDALVELVSVGNERIFRYLEMYASTVPASPGDIVFRGRRIGGTYTGTAYLFSSRCGRIGYRVSGYITNGESRVVMTGRAPRRNAQCQVVGYLSDSLVFNYIPNPEVL